MIALEEPKNTCPSIDGVLDSVGNLGDEVHCENPDEEQVAALMIDVKDACEELRDANHKLRVWTKWAIKKDSHPMRLSMIRELTLLLDNEYDPHTQQVLRSLQQWVGSDLKPL